MKTLRQLCVAVVFTFALSISTFAGEIEITKTAPPPTQLATANGDIQTGITGQEETSSGEATTTDSAAEIALNLLQSVLSLF